LIPADGFYEWKKAGSRRQPYFVGMADGKPFALAGLWEHWKSAEGEVIESCTILTTNSNELVQELHDRMPLILATEDYDLWLDPKVKDPKHLKPLVRPYTSGAMKKFPVSQRVNKATYDAADCVEPLGDEDL